MAVKVILKQDVKSLGKTGTVVEVSDGYARNYLLPRELAMEATTGAIKDREMHDKTREIKKDQELRQAKALADKLSGVKVGITQRAGEGGKLFGSVTGKEIAEILFARHGLRVDRRKLELTEPIKSLGTHAVTIKVHPEIAPVQILVEVSTEEAKGRGLP